jgi:hypothetical protein
MARPACSCVIRSLAGDGTDSLDIAGGRIRAIYVVRSREDCAVSWSARIERLPSGRQSSPALAAVLANVAPSQAT